VSHSATLVSAAAGGDEAAWHELVRRYTPVVWAVIRAAGLNRVDAADVNQTVWLRLIEHLDRLHDPEALPTWLTTTARRECQRVRRMGRRTRPFDPYDGAPEDPRQLAADRDRSLPDPIVPPDEQLLRAERHRALREAFAQLPTRCRELLALLVADPPATYRQIGRRLGMPIGSIGPTQARCLHKLRNCPALVAFLTEAGQPHGPGGERDGIVAAGR
jgi:RNA polymerase sigma factor (sigma-70 family)